MADPNNNQDTGSSQTDDYSSFLNGANAAWLEAKLEQYRNDPNSVDENWRQWFASQEDPAGGQTTASGGPSWARKNWPIAENGELV